MGLISWKRSLPDLTGGPSPRIDPLEVQGAGIGAVTGLVAGTLGGVLSLGSAPRPVPAGTIAARMALGALAGAALLGGAGLLVGHVADESRYW